MGEAAEAGVPGTRHDTRSVQIDAAAERVFAEWSRLERLPDLMAGVRRTKWIDERRIFRDADVAGCPVVWEAEILECVPGERIAGRAARALPTSERWSSRRFPEGGRC